MPVKIIIKNCPYCGKKFFVKVDYNNYKKWQTEGKGHWWGISKYFPNLNYQELNKIWNPCCDSICYQRWSEE